MDALTSFDIETFGARSGMIHFSFVNSSLNTIYFITNYSKCLLWLSICMLLSKLIIHSLRVYFVSFFCSTFSNEFIQSLISFHIWSHCPNKARLIFSKFQRYFQHSSHKTLTHVLKRGHVWLSKRTRSKMHQISVFERGSNHWAEYG